MREKVSELFNGKKTKRNSFLQKTILDTVTLLKETISNEEIAQTNGFLQKCDPRAKCFCVLIALTGVLATRSAAVLSLIYLFTVFLSLISSVRLSYFLKRTLLFVPLFSFLIISPSVFSFVTPGDPVCQIEIFSMNISVTRQGIGSAILFFMRVLSSVSLVILLVLTTPSPVLLKVLRIFRVPQLFVMILGMTYRYIYLLLDNIQNTFTAIKSRTGYVKSTRKGQRIVGLTIASLWMNSYRMQSQVYNAMISRGYTGEPKIIDEFRMRKTDVLIITFTLISFAGIICVNHFFH